MFKLSKKAQTTAEYAILIAIVVGAVVAMQVYVRRGFQGRIKEVVDYVPVGGNVGGNTFGFTGGQYEPYYLASEAATGRTAEQKEILGRAGQVGRASAEVTRQKRQQIGAWTSADKATNQEVSATDLSGTTTAADIDWLTSNEVFE